MPGSKAILYSVSWSVVGNERGVTILQPLLDRPIWARDDCIALDIGYSLH